MNKLNLLIRYYKAGRSLHWIALLAAMLSLFSFINFWTLDYYLNQNTCLIWFAVFIVFGNMFILAQLDGFSRFQNYKQVKDQIYINGFQERLLRPLLKSNCQREAGILAGEELGLGKEVKNYFWKHGYRWYHIIPDFVFQHPLFFFSAFFWRTTFFTPYYKPKFDYKQYDMQKNLQQSRTPSIDGW